MQTDIFYRDITKTENLEDFLTSKVEGMVAKYLKDDEDSHLTVRVETERRRSQNRKPAFTCELILKPTHTKSVLKVKKTNEDFYTCIGDAISALKSLLSHRASRQAEHHRRETKPEFLTALTPVMDEDGENFQYVSEYAAAR